jgi:predicted small integral membrane protein
MIFDDLSLLTQIILAIIVPPILTVICWFGGRRLMRAQNRPVQPQNKAGFWALLLAAYILFALALYSSRFFAGTEHADPSIQLVQ